MFCLARRRALLATAPSTTLSPHIATSTRRTIPRAFTSSAPNRLKEDKAPNPDEAEARKREHLRQQAEGKGNWDEQLASGSESGVKADRDQVKDHKGHMEELQRKGKEQVEKS
ncbi:hypothetical protein BDY21DRAFT_357706 [Lineolata rhizophorae]|uniref:Uncharacterized protein n=1 Tax=Lineolata rhizophorae TaxID=578093 RepID=A0A6A6NM87_9PEZI|nr:hypothetical protein BDY21DRAFT_357706 [Lineolata rhizophorae]